MTVFLVKETEMSESSTRRSWVMVLTLLAVIAVTVLSWAPARVDGGPAQASLAANEQAAEHTAVVHYG